MSKGRPMSVPKRELNLAFDIYSDKVDLISNRAIVRSDEGEQR